MFNVYKLVLKLYLSWVKAWSQVLRHTIKYVVAGSGLRLSTMADVPSLMRGNYSGTEGFLHSTYPP